MCRKETRLQQRESAHCLGVLLTCYGWSNPPQPHRDSGKHQEQFPSLEISTLRQSASVTTVVYDCFLRSFNCVDENDDFGDDERWWKHWCVLTVSLCSGVDLQSPHHDSSDDENNKENSDTDSDDHHCFHLFVVLILQWYTKKVEQI